MLVRACQVGTDKLSRLSTACFLLSLEVSLNDVMSLKTVILLGVIALPVMQAVDNTLTPEAKGRDVVDAVVNKIRRSGIFPDDREFLRRIAYVESLFGQHRNTYRTGYNGGIWQVDLVGFKLTQINRVNHTTEKMKKIHEKILEKFEIDWMKVTWNDLRKPFYSGLAARIFLADKPDAIPDDLQDQAKYWKEQYNTAAGKGTVEHFIELAEELERKDAQQLGGEIDLTLVIDGSHSISRAPFLSAKTAVSNMVKTFNQRDANIGVVLFSDGVESELPFNSAMSRNELVDGIYGLPYPDGNTNTCAGMMAAVRMYDADGLDERREAGVPRVMLVFTDGHSNRGCPPSEAAAAAKDAGITTMAYGIGTGIDDKQLLEIANGVQDNVIRTQDYETLKQQIARISRRAKAIPKKPPIGKALMENFSSAGEKRNFLLPVPSNGVTVELAALQGSVLGYYSYTVEEPSSALYDGILHAGKTFIPAPSTRRRREVVNDTVTTEVPSTIHSVYLTLESQAANTTATMNTEVGDMTDGSSTITVSTSTLVMMLAMAFLYR